VEGHCQCGNEQPLAPRGATGQHQVFLSDMPRDLEHGAREAHPVLRGGYSGLDDIADRRGRVHGPHQERPVVSHVGGLESWHLASQAMVHERAWESAGELTGMLEGLHEWLGDVMELAASEGMPLHLVGQGRHHHSTNSAILSVMARLCSILAWDDASSL